MAHSTTVPARSTNTQNNSIRQLIAALAACPRSSDRQAREKPVPDRYSIHGSTNRHRSPSAVNASRTPSRPRDAAKQQTEKDRKKPCTPHSSGISTTPAPLSPQKRQQRVTKIGRCRGENGRRLLHAILRQPRIALDICTQLSKRLRADPALDRIRQQHPQRKAST